MQALAVSVSLSLIAPNWRVVSAAARQPCGQCGSTTSMPIPVAGSPCVCFPLRALTVALLLRSLRVFRTPLWALNVTLLLRSLRVFPTLGLDCNAAIAEPLRIASATRCI